MNRKKLLEKGYFPKELPPPFTTDIFATKAQYIVRKWEGKKTTLRTQRTLPNGNLESKKVAERRFKSFHEPYESSTPVQFSISKGPFARRKLEIPNPLSSIELADLILKHWTEFTQTFKLSDISQSSPIESMNSKRSFKTRSSSLNEFRFLLNSIAVGKSYELRFDISKFYPTIYTHSIPWAILGKDLAKKYFREKRKLDRGAWATFKSSDPKAKLYDELDHLDTILRNGQERQSIGIPIGPDTSFLIAEAIGSRIDAQISQAISSLPHSGVRFYDDYIFFTETHDDAERILKESQKVLQDFRLEINEKKVSIEELPKSVNNFWEIELSVFQFRKRNKYEVQKYFSLIFDLLRKNKKQSGWLIRYALGRFEFGNVKLKKETFPFFFDNLLQLLHFDQTNFDQVFRILTDYKRFLLPPQLTTLKNNLEILMRKNLGLPHQYETSWALWLFKSFQMKADSAILKRLLQTDDSVSKLIVLDLIHSNLYEGRKPGLTAIANSIDYPDLFGDQWLFIYESIRKGWLKPRKQIVQKNEFFSLLDHYGVEFYSLSALATQVAPSTHPAPEEVSTSNTVEEPVVNYGRPISGMPS